MDNSKCIQHVVVRPLRSSLVWLLCAKICYKDFIGKCSNIFPYSRDFSPCDCYIFNPLKRNILRSGQTIMMPGFLLKNGSSQSQSFFIQDFPHFKDCWDASTYSHNVPCVVFFFFILCTYQFDTIKLFLKLIVILLSLRQSLYVRNGVESFIQSLQGNQIITFSDRF